MPRQSKYKEIAEDKSVYQNKAALYIRLSVEDLDKKEESNSIVNQRTLLNDFLSNNKDIELYNYYIDDGFSGTNFERPGFARLLEDLYAKKFDTVIVKDLSRLGRNYIEVGNYIEKIFPLFNVRFIAVNDQIDSRNKPESINSILVPFKNLMNDEYCRDISNKVKAVLNVKKKKGEFVGAYAPYGYIKDPNDIHHLIVDKEAAEVVRMIYTLTLNGFGRTAVAQKLNELGILNPTGHKAEVLKIKPPVADDKKNIKYSWCSSTVRAILQNQMYCGDTVQNRGKMVSYKIHKRVLLPEEEWIIVKNTHEAIIDRATFERVRKDILGRDTRMNSNGKVSIFAGHIKCGDCGRAMGKKVAGKYKGMPREHYHYICSVYLRGGHDKCTKHSIRNDELEQAVLESIRVQVGLVCDIKRIKNEIEKSTVLDEKKKFLEQNITKCEEMLEKNRMLRKVAYEDWKLGSLTEKEYNEYTKEYCSKIRECEDTIDNYYKELGVLEQANKTEEWMEYFLKYQNVKSLSKELIDNLIDNIYVYEDKKIKIKFKYEDEYNFLLDYIKRKKYKNF